jgi:hypothetical protein
MSFETHVDRARTAADRLFNAFQGEGPGIFGTKDMPEDLMPRGTSQGSREHLLFLTFTVAIDYLRDASQLWRASLSAFENPATRFLFEPHRVTLMSHEDLMRWLKRLDISRKHGPDAETWHAVGSILSLHFGGDVLQLVKSCGLDATRILETIRQSDTRIRFLSGDKIGPLWVRMLHDNGCLPLANMDQLPIPVDVHVARATLAVGGIVGSGLIDPGELYRAIQDLWEEASAGKPYYALRLDEPLWQQSRLGCTSRSADSCPVAPGCLIADLCVRGRITFTDRGVDLDTAPLRPMFGPNKA